MSPRTPPSRRGSPPPPPSPPPPARRATAWLPPVRAFALRQARSRALAETKGRYPAPLAAIDAIATGLAKGVAAGLDAEARGLGELAVGETGRNLVALALLTLHQRKAVLHGLGRARPIASVGVG